MSALEQLDLADPELADGLHKSLAKVEARLLDVATDSPDPLIRDASGYLIPVSGESFASVGVIAWGGSYVLLPHRERLVAGRALL
jgi:hypothetical protein